MEIGKKSTHTLCAEHLIPFVSFMKRFKIWSWHWNFWRKRWWCYNLSSKWEMEQSWITYSGMALRFGMWQYVWKTFGHLSQHTNSPPSIHTAHQSSLGSSFCVSPPLLACSEKQIMMSATSWMLTQTKL